jgi:hypothetical protein
VTGHRVNPIGRLRLAAAVGRMVAGQVGRAALGTAVGKAVETAGAVGQRVRAGSTAW